MIDEQDNRILVSAIIIAVALAFVGAAILFRPSVERRVGVNRADMTSCAGGNASSTYFRLAANTTTHIVGTSTTRVSVRVEATSTPGGTTFTLGQYGNDGIPSGLELEGPSISGSSTVTLVDEQARDLGPIYATSKDSAAGIMVTECNYQ